MTSMTASFATAPKDFLTIPNRVFMFPVPISSDLLPFFIIFKQVQKLMQENASLRTQVNQAETDRDNVEKQMIDMQGKLNEVAHFFFQLLISMRYLCLRYHCFKDFQF